MKKLKILLALLVFIPSLVYAEEVWQNISGDFTAVTTVALDSRNPKVIYAGTYGLVFKSRDAGLSWQRILSVKGDYTRVNWIEVNADRVLAATGSGLFLSTNRGMFFRKIFKGKGDLETNCLCVASANNKYFLGTQAGLFFSKDAGRWQKVKGELANKEVDFLAVNPQDQRIIYAMNPNILYKSTDWGDSWQKVYIDSDALEDESASSTPWDSEEEETKILKALAIDQTEPNKLYLATDSGLFKSENAGLSWNDFTDEGLPKSVRFLKIMGINIYAATQEGFFKFENGNWKNIYKGLSDKNCFWLAGEKPDNLFVATSKGVFKLQNRPEMAGSQIPVQEIAKLISREPTIQEIQKQAIIYNDVDNRKIADWRRRMRLRGLMPEISLDYDKTVGYSASTTNGGTYASFVGPRDVGVSFKWDVAEFVWNSYEDDIDSRARYMVQLREDILDEITRLYFERRRLQTELLMGPSDDEVEQVERDLRLQELTASIDALTGGYLSRKLAEQDK